MIQTGTSSGEPLLKLSDSGAATLLSFRFNKKSVVQQTESGNWVPIWMWKTSKSGKRAR